MYRRLAAIGDWLAARINSGDTVQAAFRLAMERSYAAGYADGRVDGAADPRGSDLPTELQAELCVARDGLTPEDEAALASLCPHGMWTKRVPCPFGCEARS